MSLVQKAMEKYQGIETPESVIESVDNWSERLRRCPDDLRREAGDYWDEFSVPAKIIGFADSAAIKQIRESGIVPGNYTSTTECKRCGPVPIFEGCPPQVDGCPWCLLRIQGLPIPKGVIT